MSENGGLRQGPAVTRAVTAAASGLVLAVRRVRRPRSSEMPTVSTRLGSASDWCASDHLVYRSSRCSSLASCGSSDESGHQTVRIVLTEDFSKPIVPLRAMTDRLLTRRE